MELKNNRLRKLELSVLVLVILIPFVISESHLVEVNYSFYNNSNQEKQIDFSDVLVRTFTEYDSICKYSTTQGISYNGMDGNFDINSGKIHEKSFIDLGDGLYKYYIKCYKDQLNISEPSEYALTFVVNSYVSGIITLSKDAPLNAGRVDITLTTSKIVSGTPTLTFSYDGIVYNDIPLFGSGTIWKGYLIIPQDNDEKVLSFKFRANDLEGRQGTEITSGNVFVIDTVKPKTISYINSIGYYDHIALNWYYDDDYKTFNIYRSTEPNPDYTDFYKNVDSTSFSDNIVEKGKTYYYRVSPVDSAGNEGDLSREVSSTVLLSSTSSSSPSTGLSIDLISYVDNMLVEVDSTITEVDNLKQNLGTKSEKELGLFKELNLDKQIDSSRSELNALKNEIQNYKLQDLSKDDLNKKLDSSKLKLDIIRKKIPEGLIVLGEDSKLEDLSENSLNQVIVETYPDFSDKQKQVSIREGLKLIKDLNIKIQNNYYNLEITYLDGTKNDISVISRDISALLENQENLSFVESIPKEEAATSVDISFISGDYKVLKEDPIISYSSDTKKILYFINKKISISTLSSSKIILFYNPSESEINPNNPGITGYFVLIKDNTSYIGIFIGITLICILFIYFIYSKRKKPTDSLIRINKKIVEVIDHLEKDEIQKALESYNNINSEYRVLSEKEKKKIYPHINLLHDKILFVQIKLGLEEFEETKDKELFLRLEKIYGGLSKKSKKPLEHVFEKIKKEI